MQGVVNIIGNRILREAENCHHHCQVLERNLSQEVENGRLFRLMAKLGFVNERPEFDQDVSWSETGDRCVFGTSHIPCLRNVLLPCPLLDVDFILHT